MKTEKMVFILHLAVSNEIHSKGYGSNILNHLKVLYRRKEIALNIEPVDEKAEKYGQRIRRVEFYNQNGFSDTDKFFRNKNRRIFHSTCIKKFYN